VKFTLERIALPDIEPVTLAEMKRHLRCFAGATDEDEDVAALIVAAREWVEDYSARALIDQTWRLTIEGGLNRVPGFDAPRFVGGFGHREWMHWIRRGELLLRRAPVIEITSFTSTDAAGVVTDIDQAGYALREKDSKWPRLVPLNGTTWTTGTLKIEFRAGFADRLGSPQEDASAVPMRFKQAIKLWGEAHYDRDAVMMPLLLNVAEQLLKPERADLAIA